MAISKIRLYYIGDGLNTSQSVNTRQNVEKVVTRNLPKKVINYGNDYGFDNITVTSELDHLVLKTKAGDVIMDVDINGASNEYIRRIVNYEWLDSYENVVQSKPKPAANTNTNTSTNTNQPPKPADNIVKYITVNGVEYYTITYNDGRRRAYANQLLKNTEHLVIPETITDESGNNFPILGFGIENTGSAKQISLPSSIVYISGCALEHSIKGIKIDIAEGSFASFEDGMFYTTGWVNHGKSLTNTQLANIGETFTVPEGVEHINKDAFKNCTKLRVLNLPTSLKEIEQAFEGCTSLKFVNIAAQKTDVEIDFNAFKYNVEVNFSATPTSHIKTYTPSETKKPKPRFYRSSDSKILAGVCGGIARGLSMPAFLIRLVCFLTGFFGFWGYLIFWIAMPKIND